MRIFNIESESHLLDVYRYVLKDDKFNDRNNIFFLIGDLGSGKTAFTKMVAKELKVDNIISPTFILHREYDINHHSRLKKLHHLDLYRIDSENELNELNLQTLNDNSKLVLIEWADKHIEYLKQIFAKYTIIQFRNLNSNENSREILII